MNRDGLVPEEVIIQILARLPVKSLVRTKCVCKLWHTLIRDKYFVRVYNDVSITNPMVLVDAVGLFCVDNRRGVSELSLDFLRDRVKVRASCNGLLCCSSIPHKGVFYVCNPMTREFKLLPKSRERRITRFYPDGEATLVGLACDMLTLSFHVVLAGYHRSFGHRPQREFVCLIYDSRSNKWTKFVSFQDHQFTHMNKNQPVFVNGALHWLTDAGSCVLVLDLSVGEWRQIQLPHDVGCRAGTRVYLLELDGRLSVIRISEAWMVVWVMTSYGEKGGGEEEWDLVDRVSVRCIKGMVPGVFPISQAGEYVLLATHNQVLVYQRNSRVWKEVYSVRNTLPLWFSAYSFRSTIFPCH